MTVNPDTNVFIDAVTGRRNKSGKDLSVSAGKIFSDAMSCKYHVAVSIWTIKELRKNVDPTKAAILFSMIEKKIIKVDYSEKDVEEAKKLNPNHFQDALHGLRAVKAWAECVVTRNVSDFACVSH